MQLGKYLGGSPNYIGNTKVFNSILPASSESTQRYRRRLQPRDQRSVRLRRSSADGWRTRNHLLLNLSSLDWVVAASAESPWDLTQTFHGCISVISEGGTLT